MRGIITLKPIDKPIEGLQVAIEEKIWWILSITTYPLLGKRAILTNKDYWNKKTIGTSVSELKQIVVEYKEYEASGLPGMRENSLTTKSLPLHPDDWQTALSLIGKDCEFECTIPLYALGNLSFAKLILPKQEESWLDVTKRYKQETGSSAFASNAFAKWLTANYLPPKPIKQ